MNNIKNNKFNKKKVAVFLDNFVGLEILKFLLEDEEIDLVYVVTHPRHAALYCDEIELLCEVHKIPKTDIAYVKENFESTVGYLEIDFLLSLYFDYILDDRFLNLPKIDAINLHPGYLPYNKGFYYYAWSLLDGTPAGVSLHQMVADVDKGNIISQLRVKISNSDTGEKIYKKHEDASIDLFRVTWPSIKKNSYKYYKQLHSGTHNSIKKTKEAIFISPDETYKALNLINQLRVFSFPDKKEGCIINIDGKNYRINLELAEVYDDIVVNIPGGYQVKESI